MAKRILALLIFYNGTTALAANLWINPSNTVNFPVTAIGDTSYATFGIQANWTNTTSLGYSLEVWAPDDPVSPNAIKIRGDAAFWESPYETKKSRVFTYPGYIGVGITIYARFIPTATTPADPSQRGKFKVKLTDLNAGDSLVVYVTITSAPLPITLTSLKATVPPYAKGVQLNWTTLSEINNFGFEVQKSSELQQGFQSIPNSFVQGNGTTIVPQQYSYTDSTSISGVWYYRLKQIDLDGSFRFSDAVTADLTTDVSRQSIPSSFSISQNYPNPFNPVTTIRYALPHRSHVTLAVFNTLGQEVTTLVNGEVESGYHTVQFDGSGLASGVYFYRLTAGSYVDTKKLLLVR